MIGKLVIGVGLTTGEGIGEGETVGRGAGVVAGKPGAAFGTTTTRGVAVGAGVGVMVICGAGCAILITRGRVAGDACGFGICAETLRVKREIAKINTEIFFIKTFVLI